MRATTATSAAAAALGLCLLALGSDSAATGDQATTKAPAWSFTLADSGGKKCSDDSGWGTRITTAARCSTAAKAIGKSFSKSVNQNDRPAGCWLDPNQAVYFNANMNPTKPWVWASPKVICEHAPQEEACRCKQSWTSPSDGAACATEQNGCTTCDFESSWCMLENPGCAGEEDGEGWAYCKRDPVEQETCVAQASDECAFAKDGDVSSDYSNYTEHKLSSKATSVGDCAKQVRCYNADAQGATYDPTNGDCYAEVGVNHIRDNNQGYGLPYQRKKEAYEGCLFTAPAVEEPSAPSSGDKPCSLEPRCEGCEFTTSNYYTISSNMTAVACRAACLADDTCGGVLVGKDGPTKNRKGKCYGYALHAQSTADVADNAGYDAWTKSCPSNAPPTTAEPTTNAASPTPCADAHAATLAALHSTMRAAAASVTQLTNTMRALDMDASALENEQRALEAAIHARGC